MKSQAVGLPADSRWVWFQKEAAQKLDESFLVCKLVELADQSHTQLILLAANSITCCQSAKTKATTLQEIIHLYLRSILSTCYLCNFLISTNKKKKSFIYLPSLSFSLSSFLLFLLDDLLWEDCDAPVCPELPELPPEKDEEEELATTLLPQRAQESSCKSTGETPSSTRKLTCSRKYRTAAWRRRWKEERNKMKKCCHRWVDIFLAVPKFILQYVQSSFMQNFCQLIVLCVAISAQAFRCSICNKLRRIIVTKHRMNRSPKWKPCETIQVAAKRTLTRLMSVSYWSAEPDVAVTTPALRKMPCSSRSFLMLRTWESRVCRSLSCRYFSFEPQINSSSFLTCLLTNGVCWIIRYWGNGKVKINRLHWGRLVNTGWKGKTKNSSDDELVLTSER